jgi:hypothetical protein
MKGKEIKKLSHYLGFWRTIFAFFVRRELEKNMGGRYWGRMSTSAPHDNRVITIMRDAKDTVTIFGIEVPLNSLLKYMQKRYDVEIHHVSGKGHGSINIYFNRKTR